MAEREHRSLNGQIEFLLEKALRDGKAEIHEDSRQTKSGSKPE